MTYNVPSPNGGVFNGANALGYQNFIVFYTLLAQATGNVGDYGTPAASQNTQKLFETIQTFCNVKYINITSAAVDLSVSGNRAIYGLGTDFNQAATTIYTIKFMASDIDYITSANLKAFLDGNSSIVPFATTGVPITGPSTETLTAYNTTDAAETNTVYTVYTDLV